MKRRSFKYIFVFNCLVVLSVAFLAVLSVRKTQKAVPSSIATALVNSMTQSVPFCASAKSATILDAKSGAVIYEKNTSEKLPMASTTKIMTALAVLDAANEDDVVEVSEKAVGIEGSSIYLKKGEKMTVRDLLYGMLLESGNDAASALAIGVFGSEKNCVDYMNKLCHSMGLVSTHFDNVHGLDDKEHYTTAYELAVIAKKAMENDTFRKIASSKSYVADGEKKRYFSNHNRLLNSFDGMIGVKTGYTSKSGRCLVTCAKRDDEEYIAVTLNDRNDWQDHKDMLEYAFSNYESYEIANKDTFKLYIGSFVYAPKQSVYITSYGSENFKISYKVTLKDNVCKVSYFTDSTPLGVFYAEKTEQNQGA